jgi:putative ABC transport system substrate-binding protein
VISRRRFIAAAGLAILGPRAARAQRPATVHRIGMLETIPVELNVRNFDAFRAGMRDLGYVEGQHFVIVYRSADGRPERFPELAAQLVAAEVDLIVARGTPAVKAAGEATRTLPIVMTASGDPLGGGVVASLAHPGGNVTGLSSLIAEVSGKRLQLLRDAMPRLTRFAVVVDMANPVLPSQWRAIEAASKPMRLHPVLLDVRRVEDLDGAFETAAKQGVEAVLIGLGSIMQNNVGRVVELTTKRRLPSMFPSREFVDAGGLMAYGVSYPDLYRRAATYVDKILKGAKPGDLPIEQPTKFELVVNLKTAKALKLTIPQSVLLRADEVIE